MAVFLINNCKFNGCGLTFSTLGELIHHIEEHHIDSDPNTLEKQELQQPPSLALSYVLRLFTGVTHKDQLQLELHRKRLHTQSPASSVRSVTPTGSEFDDDEMGSEDEDSNDSWTFQEEFTSELILSMMNHKNGDPDKPFSCPVPGCKKRYKNINGIKYHAKHGHRRETKVKKAFKCKCGKSYKTTHGLRNHMVTHQSHMELVSNVQQQQQQQQQTKVSVALVHTSPAAAIPAQFVSSTNMRMSMQPVCTTTRATTGTTSTWQLTCSPTTPCPNVLQAYSPVAIGTKGQQTYNPFTLASSAQQLRGTSTGIQKVNNTVSSAPNAQEAGNLISAYQGAQPTQNTPAACTNTQQQANTVDASLQQGCTFAAPNPANGSAQMVVPPTGSINTQGALLPSTGTTQKQLSGNASEQQQQHQQQQQPQQQQLAVNGTTTQEAIQKQAVVSAGQQPVTCKQDIVSGSLKLQGVSTANSQGQARRALTRALAQPNQALSKPSSPQLTAAALSNTRMSHLVTHSNAILTVAAEQTVSQ